MQSTVPSSSSPIQDLIVKLIKVCDTKNVKLSLHDTCLYMKLITLLFLFELEQCVEYVYYKRSTHGVSEKFKLFYINFKKIVILVNTMLQILCTKFMIKIVIDSKIMVYSLNYIVHAALNIR